MHRLLSRPALDGNRSFLHSPRDRFRSGPQGRRQAAFARERAHDATLRGLGEQPQRTVETRFPAAVGARDQIQLAERHDERAYGAVVGHRERLQGRHRLKTNSASRSAHLPRVHSAILQLSRRGGIRSRHESLHVVQPRHSSRLSSRCSRARPSPPSNRRRSPSARPCRRSRCRASTARPTPRRASRRRTSWSWSSPARTARRRRPTRSASRSWSRTTRRRTSRSSRSTRITPTPCGSTSSRTPICPIRSKK